MRTKFIHLLKSRKFWPLFSSQFLASFNDNFYKTALAILVGYGTISVSPFNKTLVINIIAAVFVLPFFIFSAPAGQLADKYEKSRLLKIVKFLEIIVAIVAIIGFFYHSSIILLIALLLLSVQFTFFSPVKYSILPTHLQENELIAGNSLLDASTFISILIGTILGGVIAEYHSSLLLISWIMLVIAIAGWLVALFVPISNAKDPQLKINRNFLAETFNIINYSRQDRRIFLAILGISWFWMFGLCILTQFPALAALILKTKADVVTLFLALFTIGIAIGSLLCNNLLKGKLNTAYIPVGIFGMSIFFCLFLGAVHSFNSISASHTQLLTIGQYLQHWQAWHMLIDLLLISICGGIYIVPLYVALQLYPKETHTSRVIASNNILNSLFMVAGVLFISLLLLLNISLMHALIVLAILNIIATIIICGIIPQAIIKHIVRWILQLLFRVKVTGLKNFKQAGKRVLVIANHQSFLDPLLLGVFLPGTFTYPIYSGFANTKWLRLLTVGIRTFAIDQNNPLTTRQMINELRTNHKILIFPEGRITVTGSLMKIYEGPVMMADKANAKIVPIQISGAKYSYFSRLRGKFRLRLFPKITITILPPQDFAVDSAISGRERRSIMADKLYNLMADMAVASVEQPRTLFQKLIDARKVYGRHCKIIRALDKPDISYQQLIRDSFILGKKLKMLATNNQLTLSFPNGPEFISYYFACQAYGITPIISNPKTADAINNLANLTTQITLKDKIASYFAAQFPSYTHRKLTKQITSNSCATIVQQTSLSHYNLLAQNTQLNSQIPLTRHDAVLNPLHPSNAFSLSMGILLPIFAGIPTLLYPNPTHSKIIPELVYNCNITLLLGTDSLLRQYAIDAHPYDFHATRYIFNSLDKLSTTTRQLWLHKFGIRVLDCYSTPFASGVLSLNTPMHYKANSYGRLLPTIKCQNIAKEITITGPNIVTTKQIDNLQLTADGYIIDNIDERKLCTRN